MSEPTETHEFDALLDYLKRTRGFDFSAYKRASLMRRIQKDLKIRGMDSAEDLKALQQ